MAFNCDSQSGSPLYSLVMNDQSLLGCSNLPLATSRNYLGMGAVIAMQPHQLRSREIPTQKSYVFKTPAYRQSSHIRVPNYSQRELFNVIIMEAICVNQRCLDSPIRLYDAPFRIE